MTAADLVMKLVPGRPRVLALGEPTHFENALLELRNDLFRGLVEGYGYRTITIESDCLMGVVVDDYVTTGAGELDDVMRRGFSHEFGAMAGNRDLVRWMREYNDGRPADQQVRFAGFDGPLEITGGASPRAVLTALHTYLSSRVGTTVDADDLDRLVGDDDRWPDQAAMMDPSRSVGRSPEAVELRLIADDLAAAVGAYAPELIAKSTPGEWERARLYARTATGLMRYHRWMADDSPARLGSLLAVRASMMAANLLALADRSPTLAFAQTSHLQRRRSTIQLGRATSRWWSAGAITEARLGGNYAVVAAALGTISRRGVETPPPGTIEGFLYARPEPRQFVDPRDLDAAAEPRVSPWFGYAPLDPAQLGSFDAIAFVRDCPPGEQTPY